MEAKRQHSSLRGLVTGTMFLVTVLLWGYLIGTLLEQRSRLHGTYLTDLSFGAVLSQQQNPATRAADKPGYDNLNAQQQPELNEASLFAPEHRRFPSRDNNFENRLNADQDFLLENSF